MTSQSCRTTHRSAGPKRLFITKRNVENLTYITCHLSLQQKWKATKVQFVAIVNFMSAASVAPDQSDTALPHHGAT